MTREQLIETINNLYTADSQYHNTAKTGIILLFQAIADEWRHMPTAVIARYATLCLEKERGKS